MLIYNLNHVKSLLGMQKKQIILLLYIKIVGRE